MVNLSRPFAVVTPTVDGDVLTTLALADKAFTPGELHRLIGAHSVSGIRKVLLRLVEQGIVVSEMVGAAYVYRLNRDHLAAAAVAELANLRAGFLDRLRQELADWPRPPVFAALFGSAARGEMRTDSDIDIFIVRPDELDGDIAEAEGTDRAAWSASVLALQQEASVWTGNDVRVLEMAEGEVRSGLEAGERVLLDIRRDGVTLCGNSGFWKVLARG